jgi:iron complex transport system substrate-binding protein
MLFALGLGQEVAAVTHECDHPPEVLDLPRVTRDVIGPGLAPAEIDRAVRSLTEEGRAIYELDEARLRALQPDLIVTQALCAVCAVSYDDVRTLADGMDPRPEVISLDPHTLGEVLGDVRTLAEATGSRDAGVDLVQDAAGRIDRVRLAVRDAPPVRVAALEWLDPVYVAGHWTPQLIEYAGGEDMFGQPGEHSEVRSWQEVAAARPEVVVVMPCGYDAERARRGLRVRRRAGRARRPAGRRGRRRGLLLAPRPTPDRRARGHGARAAPGPGPGGSGPGSRSGVVGPRPRGPGTPDPNRS